MSRGVVFGKPGFGVGGAFAFPAIPWWRRSTYKINSLSGGTISPGLIADLIRRRFALPMSLTPAQILAASAADVAAAVRACAVSDVLDHMRLSATTAIVGGSLTSFGPNELAIGDDGLGLFGAATNRAKRSSHTAAYPWNNGATQNGITATIVNSGLTAGGIAYADYRLTGTSTGAYASPFFDGALMGAISAAAGETWTVSIYHQLMDGVWPANVGLSSPVNERAANMDYLTATVTPAAQSVVGANLQRIPTTRTLTNPSVAYVRPELQLRFDISGVTTFAGQVVRIFGLQVEKSAIATPLIQTLNNDIASRAADRCRLTPRARAVLARASAGLIVQGSNVRGSAGRIVGGIDSRLVGLNIAQTAIVHGDLVIATISAVTTPTPAFGLALGWDGTGRAGSYQSGAVVTGVSPLDTNLTEIYLGRDSGGSFADGYIQALFGYPARPANAALPGKAIPYV